MSTLKSAREQLFSRGRGGEKVSRGLPIECETENEGKNGKSRTESKLIEEIVCDVV